MSHRKRLVVAVSLAAMVSLAIFGAPALSQGEGAVHAESTRAPGVQPTQPPAASPTPVAAKPAAAMVTVRGIACVDLDQDGWCAEDEARVPNVILRSASGAVAVTDYAGQYAIEALAHTALEITVPEGFRSAAGNLRRLNQLLSSDRMDVALSLDKRVAAATTRDAATPAGVEPMVLYLALAGIGGIALLSLGLLAFTALSLRRAYRKLVAQQDAMFRDQRIKDVLAELATARGWQTVAGRIVADALRQSVVIDAEAGIIDASAEPVMKFTLVTDEGNEIVFTTDPNMLRKTRLIRPGDRVVDVTALSAANGIAADVLWTHVLDLRNMRRVAPPASAHWHVVVRRSSAAAAGEGAASAAPFGRSLRAARGGR